MPSSSSVHADLTISEVHAHYIDILPQVQAAKFRHGQANQAYNLILLEEHWRAEEQLVANTAIVPDMDVAE